MLDKQKLWHEEDNHEALAEALLKWVTRNDSWFGRNHMLLLISDCAVFLAI